MRIEKFEDMKVWQKARELVKNVYQVTKEGQFGKDFGLRDQMRKAAVSIMSNISEGFERGSKKEFIQFLTIARGSAAEVKSQLYVASDIKYISEDFFKRLYSEVSDIGKMLNGFISYLKSR